MKKFIISILFLIPSILLSQDTFSIIAVDPETGEVGAAGATCLFGESNGLIDIISSIIPGKGGVISQAYVCVPNINMTNATTLMELGYSPAQIITWLNNNDSCNAGNYQYRQYGIIDFDESGNVRTAGYTGNLADDYKEDRQGATYSIQGNILLNQSVIDNMEYNFLNTEGSLAEKLMAAMQGANFPGADERCLLTHDKFYYDKLLNLSLSKKEARAIGFPLSNELINREKKIVQGTIECTNYSLDHGISMNIAGGTHHAFTDRAEAFCMLNDQAIAANYLLNNDLAKKIMIIDLDVHQGNGTAQIFQENKQVFTVSFHGKKNYPFKKEKSDYDYGFKDYTTDKEYLDIVKYEVKKLVDNFMPDFIFYLSGVDIIENDKLGRLSVSIQGCKQRDKFILSLCKEYEIPVQVSMGGGYSTKLNEIIEAHANTFRLAQNIFF